MTPRTIRRDVDKLRELGYPIDATRGVAGGYRLGPGAELPPLLLDDEEAVAVAIGLRTASGAVGGIEESSLRALAKLEQVLPRPSAPARQRARPLHRRAAAQRADGRPRAAGGDRRRGARQRAAAVRLPHLRRRAARGGWSSRAGWSTSAASWYLVAWDVERDDWRTFRVDRIDGRPALDRRFTPREPPAEDVAAYVQRNVVRARGRKEARVLLRMPLEEARAARAAAAGGAERGRRATPAC